MSVRITIKMFSVSNKRLELLDVAVKFIKCYFKNTSRKRGQSKLVAKCLKRGSIAPVLSTFTGK